VQDTPGSAAKTIWLGDKTSGFTSVSDSGGSDADLVNLVALVSEMRATLGDSFIITMSVTRSSDSWAAQMASLDRYVTRHPSPPPPPCSITNAGGLASFWMQVQTWVWGCR
jgi:hypothetical protein